MYGKHFASMYTGSMVGAGALRFAVMGYAIANMVPDRTVGAQVELNPILLSVILGETKEDVEDAIKWLCREDPNSRSPECDGKRLVKVGAFAYQVVNGAKYMSIRDEEQRRAQNREAQARFRASKKVKPLAGQIAHEQMTQNGATPEELHRHVDSFSEE